MSAVVELLSNTTFWASEGFHELYVEGQSKLHKELLVMDSHQLLFVYGHLAAVESRLLQLGFKADNPMPVQTHVHIAYPSSKADRLALLRSREWDFKASEKIPRRFTLNPLRWLESLKVLVAAIRFTKRNDEK